MYRKGSKYLKFSVGVESMSACETPYIVADLLGLDANSRTMHTTRCTSVKIVGRKRAAQKSSNFMLIAWITVWAADANLTVRILSDIEQENHARPGTTVIACEKPGNRTSSTSYALCSTDLNSVSGSDNTL